MLWGEAQGPGKVACWPSSRGAGVERPVLLRGGASSAVAAGECDSEHQARGTSARFVLCRDGVWREANIDNPALRNHFKPEPMTYEYACSACGHAWEAEQSINASPLTECPDCHQATAKRQVSGGAGFILKGGGWYADLYSSAGKGAASTESSTAPEAKAKADAPASTSATASTPSSESSSTPSAPAKGSPSAGATSS